MSNYIRKITNSLKQSIDMLAKDPSKFYETPSQISREIVRLILRLLSE